MPEKSDVEKLRELGIPEKHIGVRFIRAIENYFFDKKDGLDYRQEAMDFCIEKHIGFETTANNAFDFMKRYVAMRCPECRKEMTPGNGSGSGGASGRTYNCKKCKVEGHIRAPHGEMSFTFRGVK